MAKASKPPSLAHWEGGGREAERDDDFLYMPC